MIVYVSTKWDHMIVSDATAKYLRLNEFWVWARMSNGIPIFLVLRAEQEPGEDDAGYSSIDAALKMKGLR